MMLLRDAIASYSAVYVTTAPGLTARFGLPEGYVVTDCNARRPLAVLRCTLQLAPIMLRERPQMVITTGAAPGLLGLVLGKLMGAKTIWIDSVANSERLSMSGKIAGWLADIWLTQWEHLARPRGPHFMGRLL
jgi:UDP-N-acetylglucosamine:LPS N-acetylglucosamine transferase